MKPNIYALRLMRALCLALAAGVLLTAEVRSQDAPPEVSTPFDFGAFTEFFIDSVEQGQPTGSPTSGTSPGQQALDNLRAKVAEGRILGGFFREGMMPDEDPSDFLARLKQLRADGEDIGVPLAGTRDIERNVLLEVISSGGVDSDKTIEIVLHKCIFELIRCLAEENLPPGLTPDDISPNPGCVTDPILLGIIRHELDHAENDAKPRTENRATNECRAYQRELEFLCDIKLLDKFNPLPDTAIAQISRATMDARIRRACDLAEYYCVEATGEVHVFRQLPRSDYLGLLMDLVPDFSPKCLLLLQE